MYKLGQEPSFYEKNKPKQKEKLSNVLQIRVLNFTKLEID